MSKPCRIWVCDTGRRIADWVGIMISNRGEKYRIDSCDRSWPTTISRSPILDTLTISRSPILDTLTSRDLQCSIHWESIRECTTKVESSRRKTRWCWIKKVNCVDLGIISVSDKCPTPRQAGGSCGCARQLAQTSFCGRFLLIWHCPPHCACKLVDRP